MSEHGNEKITIVVPCYNVENYLARCIDSLLAQTYKNIEIVMVEDCSTDGTKDIVREYELKYKNVKAIYNKENGGLGHARNVAIRSTNTKYVAFIDSDDWVEPNFAEELYKTIAKNKADMAVCDIYVCGDNPNSGFRVKMYDPKPNRFGLINVGLAASSCNKLFKIEILRDMEYPENTINEDIPVTLAAMYKYKTAYTDKTYYTYYQRPGSIQNGQITKKRLDVFKAVSLLKKNMGPDIDKQTWEAIVWYQIIQLLLSVLPKARGVIYRRGLIKDFSNRAKSQGIDIINNPRLNEFKGSSIGNRLYIGGLIISLKYRIFLVTSLLMSVLNLYQRNRHRLVPFVKALRLLLNNPADFLSSLKARLFPKYVIKKNISLDDLLIKAKIQSKLPMNNMVSVVVPNYNYERFLIQRLYSILSQKSRIGEILILDDSSTDNSVELARKIKDSIGEYVPIRLINNTKNQGTFKQWEKGFIKSKYEYVWIAEADDFCNDKFLENTLKPMIGDNDVILSYVDTAFISADGLFMGSIKPHIDYQMSGHWDSNYINDGIDEIKNYSYLNNTISNVSSVVFRKTSNIDYSELFKDARDYRQAGDWVFYVNYMVYGKVAYTDRSLNYYRQHGNNVSSTTKANDHLEEILRIYDMFNKKLNLSKEHKDAQKKRIEFVKKAWNI